MKIVHSADWHIGKKLHGVDLWEDHNRFIQWLRDFIREQKVDILLVSGDIFDLANPSSESRTLYYRSLRDLSVDNCTVIITAGNHDSPAVLDAARELLKVLDVHVTGSLPLEIGDCIIPLKNQGGEVEVVVAALPYLRDAWLRRLVSGEVYEDRIKAISDGIERTFSEAATACAKLYPGVPAIAMGHLYAQGAQTSDSERDIQMGNLAGFNAGLFNEYFSFVALGHIHRPQKIGQEGNVFYSGSPIPLSFSEYKDEKRIILIETETKNWKIESIPVPKFRRLIRLRGTLEELREKLAFIDGSETEFCDLIEAEMIEAEYDPALVAAFEELVTGEPPPGTEIVKYRYSFENKVSGTAEMFDDRRHLGELSPVEVFSKRLEMENVSEKSKALLLEAFHELLEEVYRDN